jgi:hypothetical protein
VTEFYKIKVTPDLFDQLGYVVEWGQPDDEGFYTPTVFTRLRCGCGEIPQNRVHHDRTLKAYHVYGSVDA